MVPLTTAANPFAARVLAAHLGAEGIVWELRGNVDGPYPVGPVEVLVAEDDLAVARQVVREQDVEPVAGVSDAGRAPRELWVLLVVILAVAVVLLGRLLVLAH
jgi:Putative prokaryotic signal transducing protein